MMRKDTEKRRIPPERKLTEFDFIVHLDDLDDLGTPRCIWEVMLDRFERTFG